MKDDKPFTSIPADVKADMDALVAAICEGRKPDPEVVRRVRERADAVRASILATHGVQDIGVAIIREIRGDTPVE